MDPRIQYTVSVLEKNYDHHVGVRQMAGALALSPSRFKHLFKQETGQPYSAYVRDVRLKKAKQLLADWRLSVKQVALTVGYPHPANFVRAFRKRFGKTPSQYRDEIPPHVRIRNSTSG